MLNLTTTTCFSLFFDMASLFPPNLNWQFYDIEFLPECKLLNPVSLDIYLGASILVSVPIDGYCGADLTNYAK